MNQPDLSSFGYLARQRTIEEVCAFLPAVWEGTSRAAVAAYGMALAGQSPTREYWWEDMRAVLDSLAQAKARLDIASVHTIPVFEVTAEILLTVQRFAEENRINATEWPSADEVAVVACRAAQRYAIPATWRLLRFGQRGEVIGYRTIDQDGNEISSEPPGT